MIVTYKNPGFEHSINSILLFLEDGTAPFWSDALIYFYPQINRERLIGLSPDEKREYLTRELKAAWDGIGDELEGKVEAYNAHFVKYHRLFLSTREQFSMIWSAI